MPTCGQPAAGLYSFRDNSRQPRLQEPNPAAIDAPVAKALDRAESINDDLGSGEPPPHLRPARSGFHNGAMKFCSLCGSPVSRRVPPGDHLPRFVCDTCGTIHYQNPRIVVGCVPEYEGQILICKRAIEPRLGYWTVPAGFMENGETLQQGAARECQEEALATVEIGSLLTVVSVLGAHQVHLFFRARMPAPEFGAGPESLEVKLVRPEDIPWDDIAFQSTVYTLERYLEDRAANVENHHFMTLERRAYAHRS